MSRTDLSRNSGTSKCRVCGGYISPIRIHMGLRSCSEEHQHIIESHQRDTASERESFARHLANSAKSIPVKPIRVKTAKLSALSGDGMGYVYLFYAPITGQFKIGISTDVRKRAITIQTQSGMPIEVIDYWELHNIARDTERMLHERFSNNRTIGEWFDFPGMTKEDIRSMIERCINGAL